jgi:hypothetical protein
LISTFEKSEKEDQSKFATTMVKNSKKFGLDDDDYEAYNEASFNLQVVEYSQHLTYDSLLNLQCMYAAILKTLQFYPIVPMVRTHTKHVLLLFLYTPSYRSC